MRPALSALALLALALPAFAAKHEKVTIHLINTGGQDAGTARFEEDPSGKLKVTLKLKNLATGEHGVHIHMSPTCDAPDFKTAGGHFNPTMKQHGFENSMGHHAGDMPKNVRIQSSDADSTPSADVSFTIDYLSLGTGAPNDILANGGTSIIVHEKADDMKTDPSGNSGSRIACGIITDIKQPKTMTEPAPDGAAKPKN